MQQRHIPEYASLPGYDGLHYAAKSSADHLPGTTFSPNRAYDAYLRIHKVFVGEVGGQYLESLGVLLENEAMPQYLDAAGWAFAESALVQIERSATDRLGLLNRAESIWQRALVAQDEVNKGEHKQLCEDSMPFRFALNLAFTPLMKSIVVGNVTESVREHVFVDTLAIAQASLVQRHLAFEAGEISAATDHIGFEHECNALLSLLYLDDPRHIPIPSPTRAGTGYDYPEQTHDIVVINQHWGAILKAIPIEIKAKTSRRDIKRYKALLVRGKMHLSVEGKYSPEHTIGAYERMYDGRGSAEDEATVEHACSTLCDLLKLYQKGELVSAQDTQTKFHDATLVSQKYPELSIDRVSPIN